MRQMKWFLFLVMLCVCVEGWAVIPPCLNTPEQPPEPCLTCDLYAPNHTYSGEGCDYKKKHVCCMFFGSVTDLKGKKSFVGSTGKVRRSVMGDIWIDFGTISVPGRMIDGVPVLDGYDFDSESGLVVRRDYDGPLPSLSTIRGCTAVGD